MHGARLVSTPATKRIGIAVRGFAREGRRASGSGGSAPRRHGHRGPVRLLDRAVDDVEQEEERDDAGKHEHDRHHHVRPAAAKGAADRTANVLAPTPATHRLRASAHTVV